MIKIAIFISDVGYGHMVRQRSIIRELEKNFKKSKNFNNKSIKYRDN